MTCNNDCSIVEIFKGFVESLKIKEDTNGEMVIELIPKNKDTLTFKGRISDVSIHANERIFDDDRPYIWITNGFWRFSAENVHVRLEQYLTTKRYAISIRM